jgi:general secretion pathway protein L
MDTHMIQQLIIRLFPSQKTQPIMVDWFIGKESGNESGQGSLADLLSMVGDLPDDLQVWLPAEDVAFTTANIPSTQARHIQKALPFAVEEQLAQDVDGMHLVTGHKRSDGLLQVAAVSRIQMNRWIDELSDNGIHCDEWFIDAQLLSTKTKNWQLFLDGANVIINTPKNGSYKTSRENLFLILDGLISADDEVECIVYQLDGVDEGLLIARIENELSGKISVTTQSYSHALECLNAFDTNRKSCINLLQGDFKRIKQKVSKANPFKVPLVMLCSLIVFSTGLNAIQAHNINKQTMLVNEASVSYYKTLFPNSRRVSSNSIKKRVTAKLKNLSTTASNNGFLAQLDASGSILTSAGLAKAMNFTGFRYSDRSNELSIDLEGKDVGQFEAFKMALIAAGNKAELGSITNENSVVKGRIKLGADNE